MRIFDDYITRLATRPLIIAIVVALLLLLLERMLRLLDFVLDSKGTLDVLFKLLSFMVPHYLGLALPAALLLALIISFERLQRDSELDAFFSSGFGLHQLIRPTLRVAVILTVIAALTFGFLQPFTRYTYRSMIHDLTHGPIHRYLQEGLFINVKDTTYMVESVDRDRRRFSRVFAFQISDREGSSVVTARLASLEDSPNEPTPRLHLFDGVRMDLGFVGPEAPESRDTEVPELLPSVASFEQSSIPVELKRSKSFRPRGQDERELTLTELWSEREFPPVGLTRRLLESEFHERVVRILTMLVIPFLAVPLALGRKRVSRAPGMAIGLLVLIAYNKGLDTAGNASTYGSLSPYLTIWGQFALLSVSAAILFYRAAFGIHRESLAASVTSGLANVIRPPSKTRSLTDA